MDIVYACNDSYVCQTAISMVSVLKHNKEVKLHLISDHICVTNLELLKNILSKYGSCVNIIDADMVFANVSIDQQDRHPRTIYAKLFLDELIDAERWLYLDSDVVVVGSLEELFCRDMDDEIVAGVMMPYSSKVKKALGLEVQDSYICDGVVLFNMTKWKIKERRKACVDYMNQYDGNPLMQSEGTLNHVCKGYIGVLKPEYNVMPSMLMYTGEQIKRLFQASLYYDDVDIEKAKKEQKIIHYMNELYNRPWLEPGKHPLKHRYQEIEYEVFKGETIKRGCLSKHTILTAWLAQHLPFTLFAMIYRIKNGE